jgi:glycosyltransferase involved in cell wall biosynthesis
LEKHVCFTGWREDSLEIVSLMDILVHPSLSEGFGRAVLEGMALEKPVVASRVGGLREAIQDGENGFLVAPGDEQALADRLRILLQDSELRRTMGTRAREKVMAEHLIGDKIAQLEYFWLELANGRP